MSISNRGVQRKNVIPQRRFFIAFYYLRVWQIQIPASYNEGLNCIRCCFIIASSDMEDEMRWDKLLSGQLGVYSGRCLDSKSANYTHVSETTPCHRKVL